MHKVITTTAQQNILEKYGLGAYEQIMRFFPRKYFDCRRETGLAPYLDGGYCLVIGTLNAITTKVSNGEPRTVANIIDRLSGEKLWVTWFHTTYPCDLYSNKIGQTFILYGKLKADPTYGYSTTSPIFFTTDIYSVLGKLHPVYRKFKGIAEATWKKFVVESCVGDMKEPFADAFLQRNELQSGTANARKIHYPTDEKTLEEGLKEFALQDLTYFSLCIKKRNAATAKEVPVIHTRELMNQVISGLPYTLTDGQREVVEKITATAMAGKNINALAQGDVSCGKTITAFLLMTLFVENGYQATILAPTVVLAKQHYDQLSALMEPFGIKVAFLNGTLTKKQKESVLKGLEDGSISMLVGTHSVATDAVKFKNLGIAVIDEEQRFGVECREKLNTKTSIANAYISMSATPIPRTLASCLYGEDAQIFSIKGVPSGRKPVDTSQTKSFAVPDILLSELEAGRQAYVICPLIEDGDSDLMKECHSVKETEKTYKKRLGDKFTVGMLTGKMKEKEMLQVLSDFMEGKISVLISTTVVEVGVNNPNASVIVIQDAERFGLSSLHQLRGRVKRGTYKPYCVLASKDAGENERLDALCKTEDGFELSHMDLAIRKSGDLLGTMQSGNNKYVNLLISQPAMYEYAKYLAADLMEHGEDELFLENYKEIWKIASE